MSSALSQLDTASTWSPLRSAWANTAPGADATTWSFCRTRSSDDAIDDARTGLRFEDPEYGHVELLGSSWSRAGAPVTSP